MTAATLPHPSTRPSISAVGLGKLGSPFVAAVASKGHQVIGVDVDRAKVEAIDAARPPVYEPDLADLLAANRERVSGTVDLAAAVRDSVATFVIVPTPSDESGAFTSRYVLAACESIGRALTAKDAFHLVVITSTVMPGTTEAEVMPLLERASGKRCGADFGVCFSPEFIALGSVIRDFLNPDFVLIGESDPASGAWLEAFYHAVCDNHPPAARMSPTNAEIAKIAVNTYVTTKISFANMLARICERVPGGDVDVVTGALGLDARIGPKYLKGAVGYGGPCFPRDNVALAAFARSIGAPATLAEATDAFNVGEVCRLADLVRANLPDGGTVGILGLSYKPGTDVVERAMGLLLAEQLRTDGVRVVAYDPAAMDNARRALPEAVAFAASAGECIETADVVVVTTPWPELRSLGPADFRRDGSPRAVVDCWRLYDAAGGDAGVRFVPLGIGAAADG